MTNVKTTLLTACLICGILPASAQTYTQKGRVRMITNSEASPVTAVKGARVVVGNNYSRETAADGSFSIIVPDRFEVNAVTPSDEYILALPTKGKTYFHSDNELEVVVTTKKQKEADFKRMYADIREQYNRQADEVLRLKRQCSQQLDALNETDASYAGVKAKLDSLQALYLDYVNNEERMDEEIRKITEELALTDFRSLDELNRKIFTLKTKGNWKSISEMLRDVMGDNVKSYIQNKLENREIAARQHEAAEDELAYAFKLMEEAIEAYKMQHLNKKASEYYKILTDAAPDNWDYLDAAGVFETFYTTKYDEAIQYHLRAIALNPADTLIAESYSNIGLALIQQGRYREALEYLNKALETGLPGLGPDNPSVASIYQNLAVVHIYLGDYLSGMEYITRALDINVTEERIYDSEAATNFNTFGQINDFLGKYDEALEDFNFALKIRLSVFDENHYSVATSYNNIGTSYMAKGDYEKALEYNEKALAIRKTIFGDEHPYVAASYNNIGQIYDKQNDSDTALEYFGKALKIFISVFGENHPNVATCYNNIGSVYSSMGNHQMSLEYNYKALNIKLSVLEENNPDIAASYNNIGLEYFYSGDYEKAIDCYIKAFEIWVAAYLGDNHPNIASLYDNIGTLLSRAGEYSDALEYEKKALEIFSRFYPQDHHIIATLRENIDFLESEIKK